MTTMSSAEPEGPVAGGGPPFDPELEAALALFPDLPPMTADLIPLLRTAGLHSTTDEDLRRGGRFTVEERTVPGPAGAPDVPLLVCRPDGEAVDGAVYYVHGGGMIMGSNRQGIEQVLDWAEDLRLLVVSVEYRLAPETPHPGPVEDCYAGLLWLAAHAQELGVDADRIVVAGDSAGGGLAAAIALMARDRGGPALAGQVLMAPMLDDRNDSPSARQIADRGLWNRTSNAVGWTALLGDARGTPDVSPYAAPARATDLSGLPPAIVDVGSAEVFRDEAIAYAAGIWAAGGRVELHVWPGGYHGFDVLAPRAQLAHEARRARLAWLRRLLAP